MLNKTFSEDFLKITEEDGRLPKTTKEDPKMFHHTITITNVSVVKGAKTFFIKYISSHERML